MNSIPVPVVANDERDEKSARGFWREDNEDGGGDEGQRRT